MQRKRKFSHYFDIVYSEKKDGEEPVLVAARKLTDVIDREIDLCGYFIIITSEKMSAKDALLLYKSRDASEKLFRGDKSYIGNDSPGTEQDETTESKIFIEFVASIIRNKMYTLLKDEMKRIGKTPNYMTVHQAIRELEKIEMIKPYSGQYRLDHAVTKIQKEILNAFGLTAKDVREQVIEMNKVLGTQVTVVDDEK